MIKKLTGPGRFSSVPWFMALMTAVALFASPADAQAAVKTVTVGSASGTTSYMPVCMSWHDTWSESVYTADMLSGVPVGSKIKGIAHMGVSGKAVEGIDYKVYVAPTTSSSAPAEMSDVSGFTTLFDGQASLAVSESMSVMAPLLYVPAQEDFVYEGGNLHFVIKASVPEAGSVMFAQQTLSKGSSLFLSNDGWENFNTYSYNYVPQLSLEIETPPGYVDLQCVTVGTKSSYDSGAALFYDTHSAIASIYTADLMGIPAGVDIRQISYTGAVYSTSTGNHNVRMWMANTAQSEIGSSFPDVSAMTKVLDTDIVLDKKVGTVMNWTEMMKFELDTPFRYTGENLMVVVQVENETPQRVYFCVNNAYADLSLQGTGSTSDLASFSCLNSGLPTTGIYYAEPVETAVPEITLVTAREPGQKLGLSLTSRDGVKIDWGGKVKEYPYGGTLTLNYDLAGDVIKIYTLSEDDHVQSFLCNSYDIVSVTLDAPELKSLQLRNNRLESIDLDGAPLLEVLDLTGNDIFEFTLASPNIRTLKLAHCGLEQLIISECTGLEYLDVSVNALRYPIWLFWPEAPGMKYLNISFNQLLEFDLSRYPALTTLICNHNNISSLDLSYVPGLQVLRAGYTGATSLDIAKCPDLRVLDILGLQTGGMNLRSNPALEEINMRLTGTSKIDLSANTRLRRLVLSQNSLSQLDLSANPLIEHLDVSRNSIESLDIKGLANLRFLDAGRNALKSLDVSANLALDSLYCSINSISELPLPAGNSIRYLDCSSNNISSLPANLKSIWYLNCSDNMIAATDLAASTDLKGLDIHANRLDKAALEALFRQLPDINGFQVPDYDNDYSWMGVLNYKENPGAAEVSSQVPEVKGWNCSYVKDFLLDASAAIVIPSDRVYTRFSFAVDTTDPVFYVDWGDGRKEEFRNENPQYTYKSIAGYAEGNVIRIYAPGTTELGIANAAYEDVDVSGMPALRRLSCSGNNFASLDLSKNSALEDLNCRENPLVSIIFPEVCAIREFDCSSTLLRSIDLLRLPELERLAVNYCRLDELDLSGAPKLLELHALHNGLTEIDLSAQTLLQELYLSENALKALDLSANTALVNLAVDYNALASLDLSPLKSLWTAHVNSNEIASLTLANPALSVLLAGKNKLTEIDLKGCPALTAVTLNENSLTSLDISGNLSLIQMFAGQNNISEVTLASSMPSLALLNLADNAVSQLALAALPSLKELVVSRNAFAGTLDLSANPALTHLNIAHNEIESLKWGTTSALTTLFASYNKLSVLAVPSDALGYIDCTRNQLEAVSLSRHPNLYQLMLDFNKLTSVNLASNKNLWGVSLRANSLEAEAIERICSQLPDVNDLTVVPDYESWMKILFLSGNPGVATADVDEAIRKGWAVVMNEVIPVDRILEISVVDSDDNPVQGAKLVLVVNGEDVGTQAVESAPGVYVYNPLPVFSGVSYEVRVEKEGFVTRTIDVSEIVDGDLALKVTLDYDGGGVMASGAGDFRVAGGNGFIFVSVPVDSDVTVHDVSGRLVFVGTLPAGDSRIEGIESGIYFVLGKKIFVK